MTFKKAAKTFVAICITAVALIALCGCDDLGTYSDTEEYYDCFDDIVFINGITAEKTEYSVEDYFYNSESREEFLENEDGEYEGVEHGEYVYVAIPFESTVEMDSLALYVQADHNVTVYMNVYVVDRLPEAWKKLSDLESENKDDEEEGEGEDEGEDGESTEPTYDDPDPATRIGEITLRLSQGAWNSFLLDNFVIGEKHGTSIEIEDGQFILIQIRNNSGVRELDTQTNVFVDPQTGLELPKARITMTNLLVRALSVTNETEES